MSDSFDHHFLELNVNETTERRGYWLDRPWITAARRAELVDAPILAIPTVREGEADPVFPNGAAEFLDRLRDLLNGEAAVGVAISSDAYEELERFPCAVNREGFPNH